MLLLRPAKTAPKRTPKAKAPPTSESESESESHSSSSPDRSSCQEDGLIPEGKLTPVLHSKPATPMVSSAPASNYVPVVSALLFAKNKAAAEAALLEAQ